jgi:hypothetical protein
MQTSIVPTTPAILKANSAMTTLYMEDVPGVAVTKRYEVTFSALRRHQRGVLRKLLSSSEADAIITPPRCHVSGAKPQPMEHVEDRLVSGKTRQLFV